jgi:pimeloyl-ACP methyl ester carboxylesterase
MRESTVNANGIRIHCVEEGEGPLVLLVHGFPESWYSWRHQLPALAAAGFRAVAIDVRGYGRSSRPAAVDAYRMTLLVGDVVELVGALGCSRAALVGHDWGAPIVWTSSLLRPDLFWAVAGLSVPYGPRGEHRPLAVMRQMAGEDEFYVEYFQQPGRAEREIEEDVRRWLLGFYWSASGDAPRGAPSIAVVPRGSKMCDRFSYPPSAGPGWMTEADLDFYAAEFERTGFEGGLNRYRNVDRDWEDMAAFAGRPIQVPALFVGGDRDGPTIWGRPSIERFPQTLPKLVGSSILPGCGHWIQQERPEETNRLLVEFLAATRPDRQGAAVA